MLKRVTFDVGPARGPGSSMSGPYPKRGMRARPGCGIMDRRLSRARHLLNAIIMSALQRNGYSGDATNDPTVVDGRLSTRQGARRQVHYQIDVGNIQTWDHRGKYTHARMYTCTHSCTHARTHARKHARTHAHTHALTYHKAPIGKILSKDFRFFQVVLK